MDVISNNIANVNTTKTVDGGPYQRQRVILNRRESEYAFPAMFDNQNVLQFQVR